MSTLPADGMTVDDYLVWAEAQPGRYELHAGTVYAMAAERTIHARVKFALQQALADAIRDAGLPCEMLPDGMTVRVDRNSAYEPDALVYCGARLPPDELEVPEPLVVVEVLSPSTRHIDAAVKLVGYAKVASIQHYLIIDPNGLPAVHHQRTGASTFFSSIVPGGMLRLEPPGLTIDLDAIHFPTMRR